MNHQEQSQNNVRPRYCTVLYDLMQRLQVSIVEYVYLDMVFQLSRRGYCFKSLQSIADDLGMSKAGMHDVKRRMLAAGWIEENRQKHVRTTADYDKLQLDLWTFVRNSYDERSISTTRRSNIERNRSISVPKNNNRITIENKQIQKFNSNGTVSLEWKEAQLRGEVE